MYQRLICFLFIAFFVAGCGGGTTPDAVGTSAVGDPVETTQNQTVSETYSPYPYPEVQPVVPIISEAYPEPGSQPGEVQAASPVVFPIVIPTPSEGLGVITGKLLVGGEGGQPYAGVLYLGSTLSSSDPSYPPMIAFSEADDPKAVQDASTGRFLFTEVKPGTYALILWTPGSSFPIEDESGQHLLIEVKAGEVIVLGVVAVK